LLKDGIDRRTIAGLATDVLPCNLPIFIYNEHRRARDAFSWMEYAVLSDKVLVHIRKDGIRQIQLPGHLLTIGGTIRTNSNHLGTETLDLRVIFLQLAELRATKPSSLSPIEDHQNRLFALKRIQIHGLALNREPSNVRGDTLHLKREQQRKN
jgi:hypothetical protein